MIPATQDPPHTGNNLGRIIAATSFGFVVTQLDVTIVNVALPHIASDLAVHVSGLQWVVDAYTLPFAVLMLSAGVFGDRFGSRRAYLTGLGIFGFASLACGLAPNVATLVAARAAQGAGAALLIPSSLSLLNHAAADDHSLRARSVGLWTAAGGVAIALGPVIGGLLLASMGWRSIFLVNIPLCIIGGALTMRTVPESAPEDTTHHLDLLGQSLAILALTGLTCAVIELRPLGLAHPAVIGGAVLAIAAGIAFYAVETRTNEPMLPFGLFRVPNFTPAVIFGTLMNLTYYGMIFVLSLYLQQARGYSAFHAGLAYLPLTATFIFSNVASGIVGARTGPRPPMIAGALTTAMGFAMLSRLGPMTPRNVAAIRRYSRRDGLRHSGDDRDGPFECGPRSLWNCFCRGQCRSSNRWHDWCSCLRCHDRKRPPSNRAWTPNRLADLRWASVTGHDACVEIYPPLAPR